MRLKFYLLWFENEKEWIESKIESVKEIIEEYGFEWVSPKICKSEKDFIGNYDEYDLILMDYSLAQGKREGKTGASIIKSIRSNECFTPILFYSQHGEADLRKEVANRFLDGVFCADREDFLDKFEGLFTNNIKKIEDINNLRGLVMAETADLENIKEEIINLYELINCPKKKEIVGGIIKSMLGLNKKNRRFLESRNEETSFKDLLNLLDFYKKSVIISKINNRENPLCEFVHIKFDEEIIQKRNLLAHVKEKIIEDNSGKKIVLESEKNGQKLIFSQEEAKKIRKDILRYKNELERLKEFLKNEGH